MIETETRTRENAGSCDITLLHPHATLYIARHFLEMVMLYLRPAVSVLWESLSVITLQRHYCMGKFNHCDIIQSLCQKVEIH